jgi:hypothetical protein
MYTEFLAATIEAQGYIAEDRIAEAFDRLDSNETGYSKCKRILCGSLDVIECMDLRQCHILQSLSRICGKLSATIVRHKRSRDHSRKSSPFGAVATSWLISRVEI